jgi:hypothetical protein
MKTKEILALVLLVIIFHLSYYFLGFNATLINIGISLIWLLIKK